MLPFITTTATALRYLISSGRARHQVPSRPHISNSTGRPTARPALMAQAPCARRVQARPMILAAA